MRLQLKARSPQGLPRHAFRCMYARRQASSSRHIVYVRKRERAMTSADSVIEATGASEQRHLLAYWDQLDIAEQKALRSTLQSLDFAAVARLHGSSLKASQEDKGEITPIADSQVLSLNDANGKLAADNLRRGLDLISQGKVACVCLAGGQGTRLGSDEPKGLYDIGLPSHKSLFQLQAERLQRLERLAAESTRSSGNSSSPRQRIPFVVMTSPATDARTRRFFVDSSYFGLAEDQVFFAVQGELPCLTEDGKIILASKSSVAKAPSGNGDVYAALVKSGVAEQLELRGIQYIDCYCVDNALSRVADPELVGRASLANADVCAKVLSKASPEERVGVFAVVDGATAVVEYSELDAEEARAVDSGSGRLKYNWANISHFCFTPRFIRKAAGHTESTGEYHIARKKIPSVDGPVQGIKLESFIFDPFVLALNLQLVEVERASHFAPVKNANGAAADTPDAARDAVLQLKERLSGPAGARRPSDFLRAYLCEGI